MLTEIKLANQLLLFDFFPFCPHLITEGTISIPAEIANHAFTKDEE